MIGIVADIVGIHNVKPLCNHLNKIIERAIDTGHDTFLFNMETFAERYFAFHSKGDILKLSTPDINKEKPDYIIYVYDEPTDYLHNKHPTETYMLLNLNGATWH